MFTLDFMVGGALPSHEPCSFPVIPPAAPFRAPGKDSQDSGNPVLVLGAEAGHIHP